MNNGRRAERQREAENLRRMATVVRDSNDAITIQDFEGRITAWNRGAGLMYGYSEAEALLTNIDRLTTPGKVEEQRDFTRRLVAGEAITSFETQRVTKDGRILDVWLTVTKLMDDAGVPIGIASTERDITGRKRAEQRIQRLNRIYAVLGSINQAIVRIRGPHALFEEACRIAVEEGGFRMAWIGLVDLANKRVVPSAHAGMTDGYLENMDIAVGNDPRSYGPPGRAVDAGRDIICNDIQIDPHMTLWRKHALRNDYRSSATFPLKVLGEVRGIFELYAKESGAFDDEEVLLFDELAMDIGFAMEFDGKETARQETAHALEESEARYRMLFEDAQDGIALADLETGRLVDCNQALCRMVEREKAELVGQPQAILHPPADLTAGMSLTFRQHLEEDAGRALEDRLLSARGRMLAVEIRAARLHIKGRDYLLGIFRDITERKRAEETVLKINRQLSVALTEVKHSQAQLVQQARLSALGQMASGIAHDFNNLLVPLLGFSELLLNDPNALEDQAETRELLTAMHTAALDARSLIRRLREFYHPDEALETEEVNLQSLIEESLTLTEPRWKQAQAQGAIVTIQPDHGEPPAITCNRIQIREVLTNVILNAVDAMPEGGTLAIRTHAEGDKVVIILRDSGIGMTDEVRQRCFEPYFSTKGARGTGMGLAMAYGVVQRHGGSINIESELGKGTTVVIRLPLIPPRSETSLAAPAPKPARRALRVLVVDDEEWVLSLVGRYLKHDGHTVEKAANGHEGIRKFAEGGFDLVITDRAMPDMSGDHVAKAVKKQSPTTPVLLLTGFGEMMKQTGERPAEVDTILSKPMTRDELLQAVEEVMGEEKDEG